jgi:hypothetical protein
MRAMSANVWKAAASQPMQAMCRRRRGRRVAGQACMTSSIRRSAVIQTTSMAALSLGRDHDRFRQDPSNKTDTVPAVCLGRDAAKLQQRKFAVGAGYHYSCALRFM